MAFEDIRDEKTGDVKVNITDDMRSAALAVAQAYGKITTDRLHTTHMALLELEKTPAYDALISSVRTANPHLDPENMGGWTQREDMRAAHGGVLNKLIAEEASKAGITNVPVPFKTSARKMG
ncbi:MAG: hypothetical protein ACK502_00410 [Alphaproteobacteria bacterium]